MKSTCGHIVAGKIWLPLFLLYLSSCTFFVAIFFIYKHLPPHSRIMQQRLPRLMGNSRLYGIKYREQMTAGKLPAHEPPADTYMSPLA